VTRPALAPRRLKDLRSGLHDQLTALGEALPDAEPHDEALLAACAAAVLRAWDTGATPPRRAQAAVVRAGLDLLASRAPGQAVEVRVPPFGAVQCLAGPRHTRGTPPSVVETDPATWTGLMVGRISWTEALERHLLTAGGTHGDLSGHLPLLSDPGDPR
jgi:hypothetical protein